uniref:DNA_pol_E_B domain-containing protein n=1 Tax=Angiostrongylus cantonensis TaxID=6313 RepID=A0A0K0DEP9_ANGCA
MVRIDRIRLEYTNRSKKFTLTAVDKQNAFERQYNHIYVARLQALKPRILDAGKKQIGEEIEYKQLEDIELFEKAFVIGTITKRINTRPSVLKEIADEELIVPEDYDDGEVISTPSSRDVLEFEDEKQIVKLEGNIKMDEVATGCTVGLYGSQVKSDVFNVERIVWPTPCPQNSWPTNKTGGVVAFLSGLELTRNAVDNAHEFTSSVHYLSLSYKEASSNVETIACLDELLSRISNRVKLDLVPGVGDPCPQQLPQQPIHRACLPRSSASGAALTLATNPYEFSLAGIDILATSGRAVSDLRRLSGVCSSCDLIELMLRWQHIAPTCPDTVDGFPFENRDPFIMDGTFPHVMVVGNQPHPESRWFENVCGERCLMISVPRFSQTQLLVLLDLDTMDVYYEHFSVA